MEANKSPAGANIWHAIDQKEEHMAPDAEDASKKVPTMMTTALVVVFIVVLQMYIGKGT